MLLIREIDQIGVYKKKQWDGKSPDLAKTLHPQFLFFVQLAKSAQ